MTFHGDYLSYLYNNEALQGLIFEKGLLSAAGSSVRNSFQAAMSFISENIKQNNLSDPPAVFILKHILLKEIHSLFQNGNALHTQ